MKSIAIIALVLSLTQIEANQLQESYRYHHRPVSVSQSENAALVRSRQNN